MKKLSFFASIVLMLVSLVVVSTNSYANGTNWWHNLSQSQRNSAILTRALQDNNTYVGLNCKNWARKVVQDASSGHVIIPATAPDVNGWYWASDSYGHSVGRSGMIEYAQPGEIVQMNWGVGNPHTAIVYSINSSGVYFIESNWQDKAGEGPNHVDIRFVSFSNFYSHVGSYFSIILKFMILKNKIQISAAGLIAIVFVLSAFLYKDNIKVNNDDFVLIKTEEWKSYSDNNLGYHFEYPTSIKRITKDGNSLYLYGDGFSGIKVFLFETDFKNVDEWYSNNKNEGEIEKKITLSGYDAVVLDSPKYEQKTNEKESIKKLISIMDGKLLELDLRDIDSQRFFVNFKYTKKNGLSWDTYKNNIYGYSVNYPSGKSVSESKDKSTVSFFNKDLYHGDNISVKVDDAKFNDVWGWYGENMDRLKLEDIKTINGNKFFIFYSYGGVEDFQNEKTSVFLKDGFMFIIKSNYIDNNAVLNSLRFMQ
mgnify:CR=1 FL=1